MSVLFGQIACFAIAVGASRLALAEQTPAASGAVTGQLLSLFLGLAVVLAVIAGTAWLLKRLAPKTYGASSVLRVVAGAAVGQRERVVIVEVGATWLVLGVAPGSVNSLHQMPRPDEIANAPVTADAMPPFAQWLRKMMDKRNER
ncbi:MAG: flagellar biosynthetic protein FliO [Betaproteobacteria bacterium]|nr:flagellar biosynthetic protein FliO [Betaproteobacteria bacterium]